MASAAGVAASGGAASGEAARVGGGARLAAWARPAAWAAAGLVAAGLFGRLMTYPLRHDEQMYLPPGALLGAGDLYRDFGFNNLPNLPLLLHLVYEATGAQMLLLTGRLVIFAGWLLAAAALALLTWRATRSVAATLLAVLALAANPVLLGAAGMLVTNNFLAIPFALLGLHLFIAGLDRAAPDARRIAAAGLCLGIAAGFKANWILLAPPFALAALLLPRGLPFGRRLVTVALPLAIGGVLGAAPVLAYLAADPPGFVAHVLGYHQGPHVAFWAQNPELDGPKVMGWGGKALLAEQLWLGGPMLLTLLTAAACAFAGGLRRAADAPPRWPVALVAGLGALAVLVSFVPTPAFPQYYAPPIPFGIVLATLLYGRLDPVRRRAVAPLASAAAALLLVTGAPRLLAGLPDAVRPDGWTGLRVHAAGQAIAGEVRRATGGGVVATLAPLYVLEGGLPVYPELAAGPLVYRVGDLIPPDQRPHYPCLVSPTTISARLATRPPAAVLTGFEGELDAPFEAFARANGYTARALPALADRYGVPVLHLRPGGP